MRKLSVVARLSLLLRKEEICQFGRHTTAASAQVLVLDGDQVLADQT